MAVRRLAEDQPKEFAFTADNLNWAKNKISDYPEGRQASAVIPLMWRAQLQHGGWLPEPAIRAVADLLEMPYIRAFEIATFYTMFQLQPVGRIAHIQVCGTTPCMLRGAEDIVAICKERIADEPFTLSEDGNFSWEEVECAGACVNAPMVQIGPDTFEDLNEERFNTLIDALAGGESPTPGPQSARRSSEPLPGATTLTDPEKHERPQREDAEVPTPSADVSPATEKAADENAARPDPSGRAATAAVRKADDTPSAAGGTAGQSPKSAAKASEPAPPPPPNAAAGAKADEAGVRPKSITREAAGEVDKLQRISGIGPVIERTLHELGIFKFSQLAAWSEENKNWVNAYLAFKGRIDREKWVEQAKDILEGKGKK